MKRKSLFVLAASALLLVSCGGNSSSTPASTPKSEAESAQPSVAPESKSAEEQSHATGLSTEQTPAESSSKAEPEPAESSSEAEPEPVESSSEAEPEPVESSSEAEPAGDPAYEVTNMEVIDADNKPIFVVTVTFENMTEAEFRKIPFATDFQHNSNFDGQGWGRVHENLNIGDLWVIDDGVATYSVDISDLNAAGYTVHFGEGVVESGDNKGHPKDSSGLNIANSEITINGFKYTLGKNDKFWGNVALIVEELDPPTCALGSAYVAKMNGVPTLVITGTSERATEADFDIDFQNTSDWKYIQFDPIVDVELDGSWTLKADLSAVPSKTYIVHFLFHGGSLDLEKKEGVLPDYEDSSKDAYGRTFSLEVQNMWSRDMIVMQVTDNPEALPLSRFVMVGSFCGWNVADGYDLDYDMDTQWHYISVNLSAETEFKILRFGQWGDANEYWWHFADKNPDLIGKGTNAIVLNAGVYKFGIKDSLTSSSWYEGILDSVSVTALE